MIEKTAWLFTENTWPYKNLAVEEYLTLHVPAGMIILYLWQNRRSVVIGRNQDPFCECDIKKLKEDGGFLVRRLSGGGAVFHDLGNLNFTFIVRDKDYDVDRQISVILEAVRLCGIKAEKTGRNDITVEGRKFSGNAFYRCGEFRYHHGTLMVNADMRDMSSYLQVPEGKMISKGVPSVNSRVANLKEFNPDIGIEKLKDNLITAFYEVYRSEPVRFSEADLPVGEIAALSEKFSSDEWILGKRFNFDTEITDRFSWGDIRIRLSQKEGRVAETAVISDAMDPEAIEDLAMVFSGCTFDRNALLSAAGNCVIQDEAMKNDILSLIDANMPVHAGTVNDLSG